MLIGVHCGTLTTHHEMNREGRVRIAARGHDPAFDLFVLLVRLEPDSLFRFRRPFLAAAYLRLAFRVCLDGRFDVRTISDSLTFSACLVPRNLTIAVTSFGEFFPVLMTLLFTCLVYLLLGALPVVECIR